MDRYEIVLQRVLSTGGVLMLVGGLDSGKTTLGRAIAGAALREGRSVAYLDTEVGQKTVGPPGTMGLRMLRQPADLRAESLGRPDAMYFIGATSPQGQLLPVVVGAAQLLDRAREEAADLVVVDTSGLVSGVYGQLLTYHKIESLQPDLLVGLQRGEELEPLLGIVRRFFAMDVVDLPAHPDIRPRSVDERAQSREAALRAYFTGPLQRWRVKPTVFMPALPALFDESQLDRIVVGLSDGKGHHIGMGYLEFSPEERLLRLLTPLPEAPRALRLGSVRLEEDFRVRRVDLSNLFGTD